MFWMTPWPLFMTFLHIWLGHFRWAESFHSSRRSLELSHILLFFLSPPRLPMFPVNYVFAFRLVCQLFPFDTAAMDSCSSPFSHICVYIYFFLCGLGLFSTHTNRLYRSLKLELLFFCLFFFKNSVQGEEFQKLCFHVCIQESFFSCLLFCCHLLSVTFVCATLSPKAISHKSETQPKQC